MEPINFNCPVCGKKLRVSGLYAGKKARCLGCESTILVPLQTSTDDIILAEEAPRAQRDYHPWGYWSPNWRKMTGLIGGIVGIVVVIGFLWYFLGGGLEKQATKDMHRIEQQVVADAVKQYEIAKRSGSAMDAYIRAGLVAEANYRKWKEIEKQEAARAGMPIDSE